MHDHGGGISLTEILGVALLAVLAVYLFAALRSDFHGRWPRYRIVLWIAGCFVAAVSVQALIAKHDDFVVHALAHVGLGMLAPVLLMLSAPIALSLQSLSPVPARRLERLLQSRPARFVGHPITAAGLYLGGLWLLYAGGLYPRLHTNGLLFAVVHMCIFVTGCLFSASVAGLDPNPRRAGLLTRAIVLCVVVAGYGILSVHLFVNPPSRVPAASAETGGMILFFGGAAASGILAVLAGTPRLAGQSRARTPARQHSPV
ncbi:cytochrome c oxidase assembly protein [Mycetocola sp. 2940]|uniref:cytochrome c oxidase assembly protein n=1 Tax=Mycetocola sp. 2940 TaxID=3156452 RepID=UPI00339A0089